MDLVIYTFGLVGMVFGMLSVYLLLNGKTSEQQGGGWTLLKMTVSCLPLIAYLWLSPLFELGGSAVHLVIMSMFLSIPLSFLGARFADRIPLWFGALLKDSSAIILIGLVAFFIVFGVQYFFDKNSYIGASFFLLLVLLVFCGFYFFAVRNFLSAVLVSLSGEKVMARVVKEWRGEPVSGIFVPVFWRIEYRLDNGIYGKSYFFLGMFSSVACLDRPPPISYLADQEGKEIEVWYSPWFGGVTYYNRR